MAAIAALQTAFDGLRRNPVLFVASLLYAIIVLPQSALSLAGIPILPSLLQLLTFFVTPFVLAGLLGMADEAIVADTSLGTLRSVGADKYVPFLIGKFVEFAINLVFGIVFVIVGVALALTVGVGSIAGGSVSTGVLAFAGIVVLLVVLVAVAVRFLIQFYPVFIVVAGSDAIDSFTDSYRFVRRNLAATVGYFLIQVVIGLVVAAPLLGFTVYRTLQNLDQFSGAAGAGAGAGGMPGGVAATASMFTMTEVVAISAIGLAVTMLGMAIQQTYAVAFYRRHAADRDAAVTPDAGTGPDAVATDDASDVARSDEGEWRYE